MAVDVVLVLVELDDEKPLCVPWLPDLVPVDVDEKPPWPEDVVVLEPERVLLLLLVDEPDEKPPRPPPRPPWPPPPCLPELVEPPTCVLLWPEPFPPVNEPEVMPPWPEPELWEGFTPALEPEVLRSPKL